MQLHAKFEKSAVEGVLFKMNREEIVNTLRASYQQQLNDGKQRSIVFWFDQGKAFLDDIEGMALDNVRVHILTFSNSFFLKYLLQEKDTASHFLIYCDLALFWRFVSEKRNGFNDCPKPLKALYIYLTISALSHSSDVKFLTTVRNTSLFIEHWMHHETDYLSYDKLAEAIEQEIKPANKVPNLPIESKAADSFPYFDKMIILHITNSLEKNLEDYADYIKLINFRRVKYSHKKYYNIYEALYYTVKLFELSTKHGPLIHQHQVSGAYYRKFYAALDKETNSGMMKKLKLMVEKLSQWSFKQV